MNRAKLEEVIDSAWSKLHNGMTCDVNDEELAELKEHILSDKRLSEGVDVDREIVNTFVKFDMPAEKGLTASLWDVLEGSIEAMNHQKHHDCDCHAHEVRECARLGTIAWRDQYFKLRSGDASNALSAVSPQDSWIDLIVNCKYDDSAETPKDDEIVLVELRRSVNNEVFPMVLKYVNADDHNWRTVDDDSELNEMSVDVMRWSRIKPPVSQ
jgi:hypothetical protein